LAFQRALASRQIRLVLFPVPDKAMLQPGELHGRGKSSGPVARNRDWPRFVEELRREGVLVFDPVERARVGGEPRFLIQDTHWTPVWMESVAAELATFLVREAGLPAREPKRAFTRVSQPVARVGDIVDMLKLPAEQSFFLPQQVTVQQVQDESGNAWESDPKGDVLLLGDSFTNVFSMEFMGWGAAAGFAPQLSLQLSRAIDVIAQNDSGAFATREALARELAGGEDRLAGKSVVIWEFASRELSVGDWKPVDWRAAQAAAGAQK
jgi:alginate O-acetyltransferase complex protein AlgJ